MRKMDCENCIHAEKLKEHEYRCSCVKIENLDLSGEIALCSKFEMKKQDEE